MQVAQLIELLEQFPKNAVILLHDEYENRLTDVYKKDIVYSKLISGMDYDITDKNLVLSKRYNVVFVKY